MEFQSKYGQENCTEAKYLTELMCERKANKEKRILIQKFWRNDYWKPFYAQQILAAHSLLKIYKIEAILKALKDKRVNWVYSLRSPQLQPIIADEQNKIVAAEKMENEKKEELKESKEELVDKEFKIRNNNVKKDSIINKLRNL